MSFSNREPASAVADEPSFRPRSRAAEWTLARARRFGMSLHDLNRHDLSAMSNASYPGPDCLDVLEVEDYIRAELPASRNEHLLSCPMCSALVEVANPPQAFFDSVLQPLVNKPQEEPVRATSRFLPVISTASGAVLVCLTAGAAYAYYAQDATFSELLRQQALRTVTQISICVAILILASLLASRVILAHQARLIGGGVIVTTFFCAVTFFSFRDLAMVVSQHQEFTAAQVALMSKLAQAGASPVRVSEDAPDPLPGRIVAAKVDTQSFEIVWTKSDEANSKERQLAKILSCRIQTNPNGPSTLCANEAGKLQVAASATYPGIKNGQEVLALLPDKTVTISKIFPVYVADRK